MDNNWIEEIKEGLLICINVQPKASKTEIVGIHKDALKIKLTSPPVDGAANSLLIKFISKELGIAKSRINLRSGERSRQKKIIIEGMSEKEFLKKLDGKIRGDNSSHLLP